MFGVVLRVFCHEEVADDDADEDDEYLHEGDVEVANHVELREGVFGCLSDVSNGFAGLAEGL